MRRFNISILVATLGILIPSLGCQAQVSNAEQQIGGAVSAAPADLRDGATVLGYADDGTLVTIREGTNDLTCLADNPTDDRFHAACYHNSLEPYMKRGRELRAEGITGQESLRMRHEEADADKLEMPSAPAAVYNLSGSLDIFDPETGTVTGGSPFYAVYIPYATAESTGLPTSAGPGVPWIMRPGTASAHIMIIPPKNE
ncbi:MAG: hypothetical protein ACE5G0_21565 [Rhodothermales bacterium]